VAVDKWKNARLEHPLASTEFIAAVALPDAASCMFLTTLTTAVAFFATAICPVAPIKMFAIFCGLLIIFDYIMNVLLVFPALCIYDKALVAKGHQNVSWCITCTCCGLFVPKDDNDDEEEEIEDVEDTTNDKNNDSLEEEFKPNLIRRILLVYYRGLHFVRWPLLVLCLAAIAATAYFATTLEMPTSSEVRMLDDSFQFEKNYLWRQYLLSETLEKAGGSQAYVIWGVQPADTGVQSK
jgi:predicted RND superfamily exporter protein